MDSDLWASVDDWFATRLQTSDDALAAALADTASAGLPPISVSRNLGKLLELLTMTLGATRVLEIGTLGGYSSICLASALPNSGSLVSLEINARNAEVARANISRAGLASRVEVRIGVAADLLAGMSVKVDGPFDLVFIDADKENNPVYFTEALRLSRAGSLIVIDNVVRRGRIIDESDMEPDIIGVRKVVELIAAEPRVSATTIQTVGEKGYDGFLLARVVE